METPNEVKNEVVAKVKSLKNFNYNINLTQLILGVLVLLVLLFGGWKIYNNKVNKLEAKIISDTKIKNALQAEVTYHINKEGEMTAQKLTLEGKVKDLEKANNNLSESQKELLKRVKEIEKTNSIIAAALIQTNVKIDSLRAGKVVVNDADTSVTVSDSLPEIQYDFKIGNVVPSYKGVKPTFKIKLLELPNQQFVEYHWADSKKEGYPISFSVSNSNKYFKTTGIESYTIPLPKPVLDPTGWQKIGSFFKKTGDNLLYIGIGAGVGIATYVLIVK